MRWTVSSWLDAVIRSHTVTTPPDPSATLDCGMVSVELTVESGVSALPCATPPDETRRARTTEFPATPLDQTAKAPPALSVTSSTVGYELVSVETASPLAPHCFAPLEFTRCTTTAC